MIPPCKSWDLSTLVFLAQTDTTIGFLSKNKQLINQRKGAKENKELLMEFANLQAIHYRVPVYFRNFIRRAKKTSFIVAKTKSFRVITDSYHYAFLQNLQYLYSSSANPTNKGFDKQFAEQNADISVIDERGLFSAKSSRILQIKGQRIKRIR
ncbi:hypothetical protein CQA66_07445 [Helicobacter aurati]|uniref:Sua5 YciO YrdC YwlC family protein n=1 Tax=Helicobacter aurati TaxID=137778 RepID=A0A3D8J258_9HELI|nr:hypothetical protein [Helicobacter aurati]RDU70841.1 hypothetical protein CQA66_07445 [Helicobacter aurati]